MGDGVSTVHGWLAQRMDAGSRAWIGETLERVAGGDIFSLQTRFSLAPRRVGRAPLGLTAQELSSANGLVEGLDPSQWRIDQTVRILLALQGCSQPSGREMIEQMFVSADLEESVALYLGLPLYPQPSDWQMHAAEGLRSNIQDIFQAVAHRSPYPRLYFDEARWNGMILKALFTGSSLSLIQGLDERSNTALSERLADYAEERLSAGRDVPIDLWRPLALAPVSRAFALAERVLKKAEGRERRAVEAALRLSPDAGLSLKLGSLLEAVQEGQPQRKKL